MARYIEDGEGMALMAWAAVTRWRKMSVAELLIHIPNGGKRNRREAARLRRMGVRAGIPDYFLHLPRGGWCGLWIELKRPKTPGVRVYPPTDAQDGQLVHLAGCGYRTEVAYGWQEAAKIITDYLGLAGQLCGSST